jgi:uncharacterized protein (DUF342 family)
MPEEQLDPGQGLTLALSEDGCKLLAIYTPVECKVPFDDAWLKQKIADEGFEKLFLFNEAVFQLAKKYTAASEAFTLEIGEIRDATITVDVTADRMSATLTVTPAYGGTDVTREQISQLLDEHQIKFGILEEAIDDIIAAGETQQQLIAQGREPINGEDGRLQCLINTARERHPLLDEHDVANYRELGGIVTVHPGEPLMQRISPTPGEPGSNVLGQEITSKPGMEAMFASQLKGATTDPNDASILIAEIIGQPVIVDHGVEVEPTITIEAVNISTGNVDFEGTVNVTEDVQAGMHIRATGDIHIGGTVEAAVLEAGGNIVIEGGIIGHGEVHLRHIGDGQSTIGHAKCGATFSARFVENAVIEAGDSIQVADFVMQSELTAVNQIMVGAPGTNKGHIIGGRAEATLLVQTASLGSQAGAKTTVLVGINPRLHEQVKQIDKAFQAKVQELDEVVKLLTFLNNHPEKATPEIRTKAESTRVALLEALQQLTDEKSELEQQLKLVGNARIVVGKTVFGGVQIEIGGKIRKMNSEHEAGTFLLNEEGEIEYL